MRKRFARRTGTVEAFLKEWIRLDTSHKMFFGSRGIKGENYLQFALANADLDMAHSVVSMCAQFADTTGAGPVIEFLNHTDANGNDIWHYLADNLTAREDEKALGIARQLTHLEIDYLRKNTEDETALGRLLVPEVKWASVNSMLLVKPLSVQQLEEALPTHIVANEAIRREILVGVMMSDIVDNGAQLSAHFLRYVLSPKAEKGERAAVARVMFEFAGGARAETYLLKLMETDHKDVVEMALQFLQMCAEEASAQVAASDTQLAKAQQQLYLYRRVSLRNKLFQTALTKAVIANRPNYVASILQLFRNEDLSVTKRNAQGQTEREILVVDKNSPSPANPTLALLLSQDARGNLPLHNAVLGSRVDCLKKLLFGLSLIDSYALIRRIPNRYNLTVMDLLAPQAAFAKLSAEIKAQRLTVDDAQALMGQIKKIDAPAQEAVNEIIRKAEAMIQRSGVSPEAARPSFDLRRVPTVIMAMQNRAAAGGAPAAPGAAPAAAPRPAQAR